jgi:hypothetical protein
MLSSPISLLLPSDISSLMRELYLSINNLFFLKKYIPDGKSPDEVLLQEI